MVKRRDELKNYRSLSKDELKETIKNKKLEYMKLRFKKSYSNDTAHSIGINIRNVKKSIARMITILNQTRDEENV